MSGIIQKFRRAIRRLGSRPATQERPLWQPFSGKPQEVAYWSGADELFFGGAAGAGKSDLLIGLALTQHVNSIIFRREYPQLRAIVERSREIIGGRGKFNSVEGVWRLPGRVIELGSVPHEWDKERFQGRPHDFLGFDELTHFTRSQYQFLIGWNRTSVPGQRCRVVATGNPPTSPEGRWVIEEWAPWLDEGFGDPAEPGELRWYAVVGGKSVWLRSGAPIAHGGETIYPRSRTFIPGRVDDNPVLAKSGYKAVLQGMPEPLRSQMLYGDFNAGTEDDAYQVIPTAWVRAAMDRWKGEGDGRERKLSSVGVDVARGGKDATVIARRYGGRFVVEKVPGTSTPNGPAVVTLLAKSVAENPQALLCIDVIGVGASVYDLCAQKGWRAFAVNFAEGARGAKDRSGTLEFANVRAFAYWSLRELLDPSSATPISLPPDPELLTDLTSPRWQMGPTGVRIEPKEEIKKRIGRSPDAGDAVACAILYPASLAGGRAAGPSALRA